jgi:Putative quorum-sensing-regulated virulence factor
MSKIDGTYKMKFGKHKGEALQDLPEDYLFWLAENLEPERYNNAAIIEECENQLKLKSGEGVSRSVAKTEEPNRSVGKGLTLHLKGSKKNTDEEVPEE